MTSQDSLDQFESSLLTELRAHVSDEALAPPKRASRGWVAGIAAVAVVAVAASLATVSGPASTAYAVGPEPGGTSWSTCTGWRTLPGWSGPSLAQV